MALISLLFAVTLSAIDDIRTKDPMILEVKGIMIIQSSANSTAKLILSLCIKNCSDKMYFIPESGFKINFYLQKDKDDDLTALEYKHSLQNIKIQGLPVPPLGTIPILIECRNLKFPIEKGTVRLGRPPRGRAHGGGSAVVPHSAAPI